MLGRPKLLKHIESSNAEFFKIFRSLVANWNRYLLNAELPDIREKISQIIPHVDELYAQQLLEGMSSVTSLLEVWDDNVFTQLYVSLDIVIQSIKNENPHNTKLTNALENLQGDLNFAKLVSPLSGLQFTLADVCVALALIEPRLPLNRWTLRLASADFL